MDDSRRRRVADLAAAIDHTLLRADAVEQDIVRLCHEAIRHGFAFVCVNPVWVKVAVTGLRGSRVGVCSVAGFPLGATASVVKAFEARRVVAEGAREVDMVIALGALKSGELQIVEDDIEGVVRASREEGGAAVKVIIEAGLLTDEQKVTACRIAKRAGAAFVKTSTGFGPGGATVEDVVLMRRTVGPDVGVKAAGGIRSLEVLEAMMAAGANRIGTSAGIDILQQAGLEPRY